MGRGPRNIWKPQCSSWVCNPYCLQTEAAFACPTRCHLHLLNRWFALALSAGESAVSCERLELDALFLLCAHAALLQIHQALVKATLHSVAARTGYPSLAAYINYHMVPLVFLWYFFSTPACFCLHSHAHTCTSCVSALGFG